MTENRDSGPSQGAPGGRDPRLAWFTSGGRYDKAVPSGQMVSALEDVTGHSGRPPGTATADEVTGILAGWAAAESRAAARKLAAVRELIRRNASRAQDAPGPGDLPAQWDFGVAHEVAAALGLSWQAADPWSPSPGTWRAAFPGPGGCWTTAS